MSNCNSDATCRDDREKMCLRCGYGWVSVSERPSRCPHCSSSRWDSDIGNLSCLRCGCTWVPRGRGVPARCPRCRSSRWDSEIVPKAVRKAPPAAKVRRPMTEISGYTRMTVSQVLDEAKDCDMPVLTILTEISRQNALIIQRGPS